MFIFKELDSAMSSPENDPSHLAQDMSESGSTVPEWLKKVKFAV